MICAVDWALKNNYLSIYQNLFVKLGGWGSFLLIWCACMGQWTRFSADGKGTQFSADGKVTIFPDTQPRQHRPHYPAQLTPTAGVSVHTKIKTGTACRARNHYATVTVVVCKRRSRWPFTDVHADYIHQSVSHDQE